MTKFILCIILFHLFVVSACKKKSEESEEINADTNNETELSTKSRSIKESGYVFLKRFPKIIKDIDKFEITSDWLKEMEKISAENWDGLPDNIYPYSQRKSREGRDFFYVRKQTLNYYNPEETPEKGDLVEGWVDSSYVYMYGTDLLEDSIKKEKDSAKLSILEYLISKNVKIRYAGDLEIRDRFENISPNTSYYVINYSTRDEEFNTIDDLHSFRVLRKKDKEYKFIDLPFSNDGMKPIDVNGDGIFEWELYSMGEGDYSISVAFLLDGKYKELISLRDSLSSSGHCVLELRSINKDKWIEKHSEFIGEQDPDQFKCNIAPDKGKLKVNIGTRKMYYSFDGKHLNEVN